MEGRTREGSSYNTKAILKDYVGGHSKGGMGTFCGVNIYSAD
jgi:hypothetical protein